MNAGGATPVAARSVKEHPALETVILNPAVNADPLERDRMASWPTESKTGPSVVSWNRPISTEGRSGRHPTQVEPASCWIPMG
jgi:hypothetical protein